MWNPNVQLEKKIKFTLTRNIGKLSEKYGYKQNTTKNFWQLPDPLKVMF